MKLQIEPGINFQVFSKTLICWGDIVLCYLFIERDTEVHCLGTDIENYYIYVCSGKYSGLFATIKKSNLCIDDSYINPLNFEKKRKFNSILTKIQDK